MIDTHCHLTYEPLARQIDDVLARAKQAGVDTMISVGTSPEDARLAARLARDHAQVYATVGVHPHYAADCTDHQLVVQTMRELAAEPKVLALGEMGLDKHYPEPALDVQRKVLDWQLEVAAPLDLPIIIHNRKATDETLAALRQSQIDPARFVFHCFTGNQQELDAILAFGAMVSFTGIVTFKSAADLAQCARTVPAERLMVETDSPYLTPEPHRKVKVNEPGYVPAVARFLAPLRDMTFEAFVSTCDANARRFFRMPA